MKGAVLLGAHVLLDWNRSFWQVLLFCQINITRLVIDLSLVASYFGSYWELINVQMLSKKAATSFEPPPRTELFDNSIFWKHPFWCIFFSFKNIAAHMTSCLVRDTSALIGNKTWASFKLVSYTFILWIWSLCNVELVGFFLSIGSISFSFQSLFGHRVLWAGFLFPSCAIWEGD
jgi:hypothetical protein